MKRRQLLATLLAAPLAVSLPGLARADQSYPNKPVRLIVPFAPGGTTDTVGRRVAQELSNLWGQSVIIENKPGAGTTIGVNTVAKAAPDGYTLGMITASFTVNPSLLPNLPYDTRKDVRAVALLADSDHVLVVNPTVKAGSVQELITLIKANPGTMTFASFGNGSNSHLSGERLALNAGTPMIHVPYKGQAPAILDVIAGRVDMMFASLPEATPHLESGKLKALGIAAPKRSIFSPNIPTLEELGVSGIVSSSWNGLIAPAGTPDALVEKINADVNKVLAMPAVQQSFANVGIAVTPGTVEEFSRFLDQQMELYGAIVRKADIKL